MPSRSTTTPLATRENHVPSGERPMKPPSPVTTQPLLLVCTSPVSGFVAPVEISVITPSAQRRNLPSKQRKPISSRMATTREIRTLVPTSTRTSFSPSTRAAYPSSPTTHTAPSSPSASEYRQPVVPVSISVQLAP